MAEQLGTFGEDYTASVLARRGFRIVARNFTVRGGEVDIIACNPQYILFVEVKTRGGGSLISAAEAVNRQKRRRITLASQRLDAFVSAGYDLSRSEAQKRINAGLVKLNHLPNQRTDAHVEAGDLISVRGSGRMKVEEILGQTRRGRLAAQNFQYGGSK